MAKSMRLTVFFPAALASFIACAAAPPEPPPKVVSFIAEARVEVDESGTLVKVEAAQDLPEGVRTFIEQQLKTWKYVRRHREGETGNAATWVSLGACAVPVANGGYTMGLAYHGNGPRIAGGGMWTVSNGLFHAVSKAQTAGRLDIRFVVGADGKATVESVDGATDGRIRKLMRPAIEDWLERMRFDPEVIGGRPVATRQTLPLEFKQGDGRRPTREDLQAHAMESAQCKRAAAAGQAVGPGMRAVAVDSVMDIVPSI